MATKLTARRMTIVGAPTEDDEQEESDDDYVEDEKPDTTPTPPGKIVTISKKTATRAPVGCYGWVRDDTRSTPEIQIWRKTKDIHDVSRPVEEFIPGDSSSEILTELQKRYPVPELSKGTEAMDVLPVARVSGLNTEDQEIVVTDRPALVTMQNQHYVRSMQPDRIVNTAEAYGGIYLGVPGVTRVTNYYGYRNDDEIRNAVVRLCDDFLTKSSPYRASSLVHRDVERPNFNPIRLLVPEPAAAKDRRRRERAKVAEEKKAAERIRKTRELDQKRLEAKAKIKGTVNAMYDLLEKAEKKLIAAVPEVFGVCHIYSFRTRFAELRAVFVLHQHFRGKRAWLKIPELYKTFLAGYAVVHLLGTEYDFQAGHYKKTSRAKDELKQLQERINALNWFKAMAQTAADIEAKKVKKSVKA